MKKLIILIILTYFTLFAYAPDYKSVINKDYFMSHLIRITNDSHLVDFWIKYYSKKYDIPNQLISNIFYKESRYVYNDSTYNPHVVNKADGSLGVGQVQYSTAKYLWKDSMITFTKHDLIYDIRFNVHTSILLLYRLKTIYSAKYSDKELWLAILTAYNTGHPKPFNRYAYSIYNNYNK